MTTKSEAQERVAQIRQQLVRAEARADWANLNGDRCQRRAAAQIYDAAKQAHEVAVKMLKAVEGETR